jgi:hypothetical protein
VILCVDSNFGHVIGDSPSGTILRLHEGVCFGCQTSLEQLHR